MSKLKITSQNSELKIIFFGNTKYSKIGLEIINTGYPISLIVTKHLQKNPVKQTAEQLNISVYETEKLDGKSINKIKEYLPDFLIVEDYGLFLPEGLLSLPKYAALNIHHSLLPKYRGPSPAPSAILAGEKVSGVSIIKMSNELDAGDILAQEEYILSNNETTDSLLTKLNQLGGELMIKVIKQYLENKTQPLKQNPALVTFTQHMTKEDGYFDINNPPSAEILDQMIRAYHPWPGVWTKWKGKIVKFLPEGKIQMEGKKVLNKTDFLNGYPDFPFKNLSGMTDNGQRT